MAAADSGPINKGTNILRCNCISEYQDNRYGKGHRLHNGMKSGWRCTVCKSEKK